MQVSTAANTDVREADVVSSADIGDGGGVQFLTVPQCPHLTMKQAVSIETLTSNEDDNFLL